MLDLNLHPDSAAAECHLQALRTKLPNDGCSAIQVLAPLSYAIVSWQHRFHQGRNQVIIRFHNGYGAIFSEFRPPEDIYEIAPLRFHGPGPYDYDFYFRSHVADLTWSSDHQEILRVCEQIAHLLPTAAL